MAKKGGSGGSSPSEAPNTLQTNTTARLLFLLGEGEMEAPLVNGFQSIFLNGTPAQNPDGSFNFNGVTVGTAPGTAEQGVLPGFSDAETEIVVGIEVRATTPITQTINDATATAVRVTIEFPSLFAVDNDSGDINPTSVAFAVDIAASGGPFVTVLSQSLFDKCSSPADVSWRFPLDGAAPWQVRVRRITPDSTLADLQNKTVWKSFTVIEDFQLSYPHSALLGVAVDASQFGTQIPTVEVESLFLRTPVPANWNPTTRTYAGLWDGTFKTAWHDNPAWVFYALASNERYGCGEFLPAGMVDKFTLYAIAQYCDGLVPDGAGGLEPRFRFNGWFDVADDPIRVLAFIASVFRGLPFWGGAGLSAFSNQQQDPAKVVVPANVVGGRISYEGQGLKARHTVALVTWFNPANGYAAEILPVESDPAEIARFGWRETAITALGATSRGQAWRTGQWLLAAEARPDVAKWTASWDQADLVPGEFVEIQDRAYLGLDFGGRIIDRVIVADQCTGLVLDRPVTLAAGIVYTLAAAMPNGTVAHANVVTPASTAATLALDKPFPAVPLAGAVWALSSPKTSSRLFQVTNRKETDKHLFAFTAVFFDPTAQARIEDGRILEAPSYTALPTGPIKPPTNLTTKEGITLAGGSVARAKVVVSWTGAKDPRVVEYQVQVKAPAGDWLDAPNGFVAALSLDVLDLAAGRYGFRVRALDALGQVSVWLTLEAVALQGLLLPPDPVANLRLTYVDDNLSIAWDEVADARPHRYAVRKGDSADTALELGTLAHPPFASHGAGIYWAATYVGPDSARSYSAWRSVEVVGPSLTANVVAVRDEAADGWPGVFTGTVGKSGSLIRTGGGADVLGNPDFLGIPSLLDQGAQGDGTYEMAPARYVNVGRVAPCRVTITWKGTAAQVGQDILSNPDLLNLPDFLGSGNIGLIDVYPEVAVAQNAVPGDVFALDPGVNPGNDVFVPPDIFSADVSFGPWQKYEPGVYLGQAFRARLVLKTRDAQTIAIGLAFKMTVDVPDRLDTWALVAGVGTSLTGITVPSGGLVLVFAPNGSATAAKFNGGVGTDTLPHIQITNTNGVNYDFDVQSLTATGCTIFARQSGVAVAAAKTNIQIQGY